MKAIFLILISVLLSVSSSSGQSLADVLNSIQERKLLLEQAQAFIRAQPEFDPGFYYPGGNSDSFGLISWTGSDQPFPTATSLDSLSIEGRVRLLNEARHHFQIIRAGFVNVAAERLDGTPDVRPPAVIRRFDELSLPTPPVADHDSYIQILRELACKVDALRVTPWPVSYTLTTDAVNNGEGENPQSSGADKLEWNELNQSSTAPGYFWAPEIPVQAEFEVGGSNYESDVGTEGAPNWQDREFRRIRRTWPSDFTLAFAPTGLSLPDGVSPVEGTCVVLSEQLNSPYLGASGEGTTATPIPQEGGYKILKSETSVGSKTITPPEWVVSGSWVPSGAPDTDSKRSEHVFKPTSETSSFYDSYFSGGPPHLYRCIKQNIIFLLVPDFVRGLNESSEVDYAWDRPRTPGDPGRVSASGGSSKMTLAAGRGEAMYTTGTIQIQHGWTRFPGIGEGAAVSPWATPQLLWGHPNESLEYLDYFTDETNHRRFPLSFGTQLRFAGPERDYKVFYETRFGQGRADLEDWPESSVGVPGRGWQHGMAYYWEWQKPRLRQVLGREALINITVGSDDYTHTLSIYRIPVGHTITYDTDGFVATGGMGLLKTVTINGSTQDAEGFPTEDLELSVEADGGEWTVEGSTGLDSAGYPGVWDVTLIDSGDSSILLQENWSSAVDFGPTDSNTSNSVALEAPLMGSFQVVTKADDDEATETTHAFTTVSVRSLIADPLPRISDISQTSDAGEATTELTYETGANSPDFPTTIVKTLPDEPRVETKLQTSGIPDYIERGEEPMVWRTDWELDEDGLLKAEHGYDEAIYARDWIKWDDGGWTVTHYAASSGMETDTDDESVDWTKLEVGKIGGSGFVGLPHQLSRKDGSRSIWDWTINADGSMTVEISEGEVSGGAVTSGTRTVTKTNKRGYITSTEGYLLQDGTPLEIGGSFTPEGHFSAWGAPLKSVAFGTGLETEVILDGNRDRPATATDALGVATSYSGYDALGRLKSYTWDGHAGTLAYNNGGFGVNNTLTMTGLGNRGGSTSFDAFGRPTAATVQGGRPMAMTIERADGETTTQIEDAIAGRELTQVTRAGDGTLASQNGTITVPVTGEDLSVVDGLFIRQKTVAGMEATATVHEDAWGRVRTVTSPDSSGATTDTTFSYSDPDEVNQTMAVTLPSGRVFVRESNPFHPTDGAVVREGWKKAGSGQLIGDDRYWESRRSNTDSTVTTTLLQNRGNKLDVVASTVFTPATGRSETTFEVEERTLTQIPNFSNTTALTDEGGRPAIPARTTRTVSSQGWWRDSTMDKHARLAGLSTGGSGIGQSSMLPTLRDDGSIEEVVIDNGTGPVTISFTEDGRLDGLELPGLGAVDVDHDFWNGGDDLTINGERRAVSGDGLRMEREGDGVFDHSRTTDLATKKTLIEPDGAIADDATAVSFNTAGSPTGKDYPGIHDTAATWQAEGVIDSFTLGRDVTVNFLYSDEKPAPDQFKDLWKIEWPAVQSGPFYVEGHAFYVEGHVEEFTHDTAGRIDAVSDASGTRLLTYTKDRLETVDYTSGALGSYDVERIYADGIGRLTGIELMRDGIEIHSAEFDYLDDTHELAGITSDAFTAEFERDHRSASGPRLVTGVTRGPVIQRFLRDYASGGRITHADTKNAGGTPTVTGAPGFQYTAWDNKGRRTACTTTKGIWEWGFTNGQLTGAENTTLEVDFSYTFDGRGRRTNFGANGGDPLNRFLAMTHPLVPRNLFISAVPGALLYAAQGGGPLTQMIPFDGEYVYPVNHPGAPGGWVPWHVKGVLEHEGDVGAFADAVAEFRGQLWFPPENEEFNYDADGNRDASSLWEYGWDSRNRLVRARTNDWKTAAEGWDLRFDYDSEGRRFKKQVTRYEIGEPVERKNIHFVWDGWDLLYERHEDPFGNFLMDRKYLWGPDVSGSHGGAGGAGGLLLIRETRGEIEEDYYPLYDGTGHVTGLADSSGNLLAEYWWGPFGELIEAKGEMAQANPWRYGTKYFDSETGLYYFGHRYYDPVSGQFLSREPLGEDETLNLYAYCHNDPINKVDVLGLAERSLIHQFFFGLDPIKLGPSRTEQERQAAAGDLRLEMMLMLSELEAGIYEGGSIPLEAKQDFVMAMAYDAFVGQQEIERQEFLESLPQIRPIVPVPPPHMTAPQTIGANNSPLLADLNSGFLLPTGAVTGGSRLMMHALRGSRLMTRGGTGFLRLNPVARATIQSNAAFLRSPQAKAVQQHPIFAARTGAGSKIPWGFWDDYAKVAVNGREYAQVGNRLYTRHAVDRMTPSGYGTAAGARHGDGLGRSISPNFIEDVITTGQRTDVVADGVTRSIFRSGSVEVVTEGAGRIVISVNPFKY